MQGELMRMLADVGMGFMVLAAIAVVAVIIVAVFFTDYSK